MKRNTGSRHPPGFLQHPKPGGTCRPPAKPQRERAPAHHHPPVPQRKPRSAGRRQRKPEDKIAPEYTKAPGRPPPGRRHRQLLSARGFSLPSLAPSRRSGSGFGHRTPERRRPQHSRPEPRILCAETKTRPRPPSPPRDPPVPQRGQEPLISLRAGGGDGAAPRSGIHPPRGRRRTLPLSSTPPERGGLPSSPLSLPRPRGERSPTRGRMRHAWPLAPAVPRRSRGG